MTATNSEPACEVRWESDRVRILLHLNPVPASRPRVTRWGTYYGKNYKKWMAAAHKAVPEADSMVSGQVRAQVRMYVQRPRTSKLVRPKGDIDNYLKALFDVITKKGYWEDDDEVVQLDARKEFTDEGGRAEILIEPL